MWLGCGTAGDMRARVVTTRTTDHRQHGGDRRSGGCCSGSETSTWLSVYMLRLALMETCIDTSNALAVIWYPKNKSIHNLRPYSLSEWSETFFASTTNFLLKRAVVVSFTCIQENYYSVGIVYLHLPSLNAM